MTGIYDDAGLSRRDRAKLVAELMAKAGEVKAGPNRRVRANLVKRILQIVELLGGKSVVTPPTHAPVPPDAPAVEQTDPQWVTDNAVLQQMIERTHPRMNDPEFASDVKAILRRWEDDAAKLAVITAAVDEWAKFAIDLTKDL